jgi:hypothetical protein
MAQKPNKAVLAAITAAVASYVKTAQLQLPVAVWDAQAAPMPTSFGNLYGFYGRQQMMDLRRLVSLRLMRR